MDLLKSLTSRKLFWLAVVYIALLTWSGIYRANFPAPETGNDKKSLFLNAVGSGEILPQKIRVTYKETNPAKKTSDVPVIFVHGSPGSAEAFDGLTKLIKNRRIIAVDLPGFGDSETNVPDYSILAHSRYVIALMDNLDIKEAHFVGFSLGGGVVLHIAGQAAERVKSISFISSIGAQEYELFGNYRLNHIVHGAQLGFFWFLKEFTPHFGIFDGMTISYARNFYDTDQRPLRRILEEVDIPFQIIHGKEDPLVPVEAAREHARIVPQSEYHELEDNHFFLFIRPEIIRETLESFWTRVESGEAKTLKTAEPERIAKSKEPHKHKILKAIGPTAFVFFLLLFLTALINEDFSFLLGGFFAAQGRFGLVFAIISGVVGASVCAFVLMLIGRSLGQNSTGRANTGSLKEIVFGRRLFSLRFEDYFQTGKARVVFWKSISRYLFSSAIYAGLVVVAAFTSTKLLSASKLIDPDNTWNLITIIGLFIVPLMGYRVYRRHKAA